MCLPRTASEIDGDAVENHKFSPSLYKFYVPVEGFLLKVSNTGWPQETGLPGEEKV